MALGAQQRDLLKMVIKQALLLAVGGVAIGLIASFGLTRLMSSLLFGVKPTDPATFVITALLLATTALVASYLPARRATKIDPLVALRYE
jgi:putative ABC transport system permease protein